MRKFVYTLSLPRRKQFRPVYLPLTDRMVIGMVKGYLFGYCLVGITAIVMSGGLVLYVIGSQIHKHHSIVEWNEANGRR